MANRPLTADVVANEALAILDNELGWLSRIHRGYEDEYTEKVNGYKKGQTISIRRPADPRPRIGATASPADHVEGKVQLTVDTQIGHDFQFTSKELTLEIDDLSDRVIKPAMVNIVNYIASDVATAMYAGAYNWVGTPGQTINSYADFIKGPERLNEMAVPMSDRCSLMSPSDHAGLLGAQTGLYITGPAEGAYRTANLGRIADCDIYMSQVTPVHTNGTADSTTPLVDGADQNVTYATAKDSWSQTLVTDGWDSGATLSAGTVFTIAGVNMVNPKTKVDTGILQQFVVVTAATANATTTADTSLTISPPIIISGPHQTVTAKPADNAAITVVGSASTAYRQNMVFHKNAMALAVVPMELPQGAVNPSRKSRNGLSVRVVPYFDGTNDVSNWRLDILYGKKLIDPRLITRLSGTG